MLDQSATETHTDFSVVGWTLHQSTIFPNISSHHMTSQVAPSSHSGFQNSKWHTEASCTATSALAVKVKQKIRKGTPTEDMHILPLAEPQSYWLKSWKEVFGSGLMNRESCCCFFKSKTVKQNNLLKMFFGNSLFWLHAVVWLKTWSKY